MDGRERPPLGLELAVAVAVDGARRRAVARVAERRAAVGPRRPREFAVPESADAAEALPQLTCGVDARDDDQLLATLYYLRDPARARPTKQPELTKRYGEAQGG